MKLTSLQANFEFVDKHIGPSEDDSQSMLNQIDYKSLEELIKACTPKSIALNSALDLPESISEADFLDRAREVAQKNKVYKSYIGLGYSPTFMPNVIKRNIFENPAWYTAYTPYQAEISQGRMEALLNYQTMICEMTGMEIANASLLDEATAVAEAVTMSFALQRKNKSKKVFVSSDIYPQTLEVLETRTKPLNIELVIGSADQFNFSNEKVFAAILQYPNASGSIQDFSRFTKEAKSNDVHSIFVADLLSLSILNSPANLGADIVVGSSQRFGLPMGYGGPHSAYIATKLQYKRNLPGRIIGVSKDSQGQPALRLALQTREQHIRREKATSNICTAQVLLAVLSSMYAVYHGPQGLKKIGRRIYSYANALRSVLSNCIADEDIRISSLPLFDTIEISISNAKLEKIRSEALNKKVNFYYYCDQSSSNEINRDNKIRISLSETTSTDDLIEIINIFTQGLNPQSPPPVFNIYESIESISFDNEWFRKDECLKHKIFCSYSSETEMLRYIHRLEKKDLSLTHSMIPLGSCTMKLNATSEMIPVSWPEFSSLHPFCPIEQAQGYLTLFNDLEKWLREITGYAAISLQPNAGSQGELAGLLVIKKYLESKNQSSRNVCLIPSSAHGTNPASAVMAGFEVVVVQCDEHGNIDFQDLEAKCKQHSKSLGALMITYPSTHGVFEENITEVCDLIHRYGGQVYLDESKPKCLSWCGQAR